VAVDPANWNPGRTSPQAATPSLADGPTAGRAWRRPQALPKPKSSPGGSRLDAAYGGPAKQRLNQPTAIAEVDNSPALAATSSSVWVDHPPRFLP